MAWEQNGSRDKGSKVQDQASDAAKAGINQATDQGARAVDATRKGIDTMQGLGEQAAESTRQVAQTGLAATADMAREAGEKFTRSFGLGGEDGKRLAEQSKQNMDAVARCGTILTQGFQDASRGWLELGQKQWQRNLDGVQRLARVRTAHEFASVQSELLREGMQQFVQDSRVIAERSMRVTEEAGKTFANVATQGGRN